MESRVKKFMKSHATTMELLQKLGISVPTIHFNDALGEEMSRDDVDRLLKIIQIHEVSFDVKRTW